VVLDGTSRPIRITTGFLVLSEHLLSCDVFIVFIFWLMFVVW
jgi:hypothetical protein